MSNSDDLTRDTTPRFLVVGPPDGVAKLYFNNTVVAQDPSGTAAGSYLLTTSALPEGLLSVRATVTVNGVESDFGDRLFFTIDITPPPTPTANPTMDMASDTGFSSFDAITSDATPSFHGTTPAVGTLTLLIDGAAVTTMPAIGSLRVHGPRAAR